MKGIHEYFSSKDSEETLKQKIKDSGFTQFTNWPNSYSFNGNNYAFIVVQDAKSKGFSDTHNNHIMYLELSKDPTKYPKDHPMFKLFKLLNDPVPLGTTEKPAKYSIDTYVK
jgi:hypothetical protein